VAGHESFTHLRDLYFSVNPSYEGRFTVPVLFDKKTQTIVNNESSEILRMFNTEVGTIIVPFASLLTG
jgi:putative glutathione S-transferase